MPMLLPGQLPRLPPGQATSLLHWTMYMGSAPEVIDEELWFVGRTVVFGLGILRSNGYQKVSEMKKQKST